MIAWLLQCRRDDLVPTFLGRNVVEISECTFLGPVENVETEHLYGGRRIAGRYTGAQDCHRLGAAAAGNRHIGPSDPLTFQILFQNVERRSLTARCPPVQNLYAFGRAGTAVRHSQCQCHCCRRHQKLAHRILPFASQHRGTIPRFPKPTVDKNSRQLLPRQCAANQFKTLQIAQSQDLQLASKSHQIMINLPQCSKFALNN